MRNWHGNLSPFGKWHTAGSRVFSPAILFANDEAGVWYDPSDLSTLFQDTAGTTPVTTAGQTVGLMLDKSGNGYHATQPTAAARPTYQTDGTLHWLSFDGVDDFMVTPTITPGIDKAQVFAGVRKLSDAAGMIAETGGGTSYDPTGSLFLLAQNLYGSASRGDATPSPTQRADTGVVYGANTSVITTTHDIPADLTRIAMNQIYGSDAIGDKGHGNFLAYPMYIGKRGGTSLPFTGNIYSLVTRFGANLETSTIETTETYVAGKTGVTL